MKSVLIELGAAALLLLAMFGIGHYEGARGVRADWDTAKLGQARAEKQAILDAVAANNAEHELDLHQSQKVIADYENRLHESDARITDERAAADHQRLRITIPERNCPAPAGEAPGAVVVDGAGGSEQVELPEAIERDLRDLAEAADREVASCQAKVSGLQDWVVTHGLYGPKSALQAPNLE